MTSTDGEVAKLVERLRGLLEKATPLVETGNKGNVPAPRKPGQRLVGFYLRAEVAGLSEGLFMLDAIQDICRALPALLNATLVDREEIRREATRPIIGIENRTPQEVFDIMSDRFLTLNRSTKGA